LSVRNRDDPQGQGDAVTIQVEPIGFVLSPRVELRDDDWGGVESRIVLDGRFEPDALEGIDAFSHAEILFHFDRVDADEIVAGAEWPGDSRRWHPENRGQARRRDFWHHDGTNRSVHMLSQVLSQGSLSTNANSVLLGTTRIETRTARTASDRRGEAPQT
jgi:hypothetical protein